MTKISLIGAGQIGGTLAHLIGLKELNLINKNSYIFAESSKKDSFEFNGYEIFDTKTYGKSKLTILRLI